VFIGDQAGRFWCLDAQSGHAIWSQEPSPEHALPIAATSVVIRNLVIIATRDAVAVAYEVETGREVWRRTLDGPVGSEVFNFKGQVALRTFWSAYVLGARDGEVAARWHWRGRYTRHLSCTNDALLVVTQKAHGDMATRPSTVLLASVATDEGPLLIGLDRDGERFRSPCPRSLVGLRWSAETGLVYESRLDGLGILHPRTGERLYELTSPNERDGAHGGHVDVHDDVIYMLDVRGALRALRHPARLRVRRAG
jgi:outer membrane protein assembly factor BamB